MLYWILGIVLVAALVFVVVRWVLDINFPPSSGQISNGPGLRDPGKGPG